jgi:hypothetical protein
MNKPITNDRVTGWLPLLQEFNITILDRLGKENVVIEFIYRINNEGELVPINDNFPDEHLFAISTKSHWFVVIVKYLAIRKLPQRISTKEKQKIIKLSATYS